MITKYRIETWNPKTNKYTKLWEGPVEYAELMMNKGYMRRSTRRLIKTTEEIIRKEKKSK